jgi:hypothetical protein
MAPGLWVEHCTLRRWTDPISSIETIRADFVGTWPNTELEAFTQVPVHRYPNTMFGLRFSGYFHRIPKLGELASDREADAAIGTGNKYGSLHTT